MDYLQSQPVSSSRFENHAVDWRVLVSATLMVSIASIVAVIFVQ
jgi:hypothetical protein